MIILDVIQQSPEWFMLRKDIPTASEFKSIFTSQGKRSKSIHKYARRIIDQADLKGAPLYLGNEHTERGNRLEPEARRAYEFQTGNEVEEVGFITTDCGLYGCSPDGLVKRRKRGYEGKCPILKIHDKWAKKGTVPSEHMVQCHGSMWVCGFDEWDFCSYNQEAELFITTVKRDFFTEKLGAALEEFNGILQAARELMEVAL